MPERRCPCLRATEETFTKGLRHLRFKFQEAWQKVHNQSTEGEHMDRLEPTRRIRARIVVPVGIIAALVTALAVSATVGFAAPSRAAIAPNNTAPPTITGTAKVGSTLTVHNGTWAGSQPI